MENSESAKQQPETPVVTEEESLVASDPAKEPTKKKWFFRLKIWQRVLLITGAAMVILIAVLGVLAFRSYQVSEQLKVQASEAEVIGRNIYASFKAQDLPPVQTNIKLLEEKLTQIDGTFSQLSFFRYIPIARQYYFDGEHGLAAARAGLQVAQKSVDALVPYADVLGFAGEGSFEGGTAEDRLKILLETLDKIAPILDDISADLEVAQAEIKQIDPARYPESFQGKPVRSYIEQMHAVSDGAVTALTEYRPVLEELPAIAGGRGERRKYLVLFQNDAELRPTGGFLTAFAVINVENGKVEAEKSDDIYELDKKIRTGLPIPEEMSKYLTTEKTWNLRDMNTSPDFKVSMDQFFQFYEKVPGEPDNIDGIIAVDTKVLTDLLRVLGPVEVPGYGTFSSEIDPRCDCPEIIYVLSEIITRPTPYLREDRKGVLGPLMRAVLTKSYTAPKSQWPPLFSSAFENITGRHIQFYFFDQKSQQVAETINAAGRITPPENNDFLGIVNANLGGAKSNLFISYEVEQVVSAPKDGFIEKTVEINYKNSRKGDNCNLEAGLLCLNSTLRDWTRIYIPAGSELISSQGFVSDAEVKEDLGFSVIQGYFTLEPLGSAKLVVTYKVPYTDQDQYRLEIWKQGGTDEIPMLLDVTGGQEQLTITKDVTYSTEF